MRKLILAAALSLVAAGAANASGAPKAASDKVGQYVDINQVAVPILANGKLVNYVLVQVRLNLAANVDAIKIRDKEPLLRDALVRAAHRTSFAAKTDYLHVDEATVKTAVMRDVAPMVGAKAVTSVEIVKQNPTQRTGLPRPKA